MCRGTESRWKCGCLGDERQGRPVHFPGNVVASGLREAAVEVGAGGPRRPGGCGLHR